MQHRGHKITKSREADDLGLDCRLPSQTVKPSLLAGVDVGLLDGLVRLDEIEPEEELQFIAGQELLKRHPDGLVDLLTAVRQTHEQVVPQQVTLGQLQTCVVQRLE